MLLEPPASRNKPSLLLSHRKRSSPRVPIRRLTRGNKDSVRLFSSRSLRPRKHPVFFFFFFFFFVFLEE